MKQEIKQRIEQIKNGEVPQGYKKTKIGIVPNEWEEIKFDTLFESLSEYTDDLGKYKLYSLTIEDGVVEKDERYERSHLVKKENSYKIIPSNYFAYNPMNVRFGAVARNKSNKDGAISGYYDIFTTKNEFDLEFMDNFLVSSKMINYYNMVSTGSLIEKQRVHFSQFINFQIPLPNSNERKKISEILSTQDKVIELKEKLLKEKEKQKKYLMQNLLTGRKRLKGFNGEWKKVKLGEICNYNRGITYSKNDENTINGYKVLRANNISTSTNSLNFDDVKMISKNVKVKDIHKLKENDILICSASGSKDHVGKVAYISNDMDYYYGGFMAAIRTICDDILSKYLFYFFTSEYFNYYLNLSLGTTTINNLNSAIVLNCIIPLPHIEEQKAIAEILTTADKELKLLQEELEEEKRKKKALMQLLLAGIVRVKV